MGENHPPAGENTVPDEDQVDPNDEKTASDPADQKAGQAAPDDADALRKELAAVKAEARKHEGRSKEHLAWRRANESKVQQYDALAEASKTEQERAVEQARKDAAEAARTEAASEALNKFGPRLVGAEFRAHLAGRMTAGQIADLVDGLNVAKFLTDEGEPDVEAIQKYAAGIAPAPADPLKAARPDLGGGRRDSAKATGVQAGTDLYASKHPKKTTPA